MIDDAGGYVPISTIWIISFNPHIDPIHHNINPQLFIPWILIPFISHIPMIFQCFPMFLLTSSQIFKSATSAGTTSLWWRSSGKAKPLGVPVFFEGRLAKISEIMFKKQEIRIYGGFHTWGYPKWMVYKGKIPLKWMNWGYPYSRKPSYIYIYIYKSLSWEFGDLTGALVGGFTCDALFYL